MHLLLGKAYMYTEYTVYAPRALRGPRPGPLPNPMRVGLGRGGGRCIGLDGPVLEVDTQSSPPSSPFRGKSRVHDDEKEPVGAPTALLIATARLDVLRWCAQADPRNPLPTVEFRDRAPPCARHRPVDAA